MAWYEYVDKMEVERSYADVLEHVKANAAEKLLRLIYEDQRNELMQVAMELMMLAGPGADITKMADAKFRLKMLAMRQQPKGAP